VLCQTGHSRSSFERYSLNVQCGTCPSGITRVQCPLLILLGTNEDVGNEEDLERIKSSIKRLSTRPSRVDTALIQGADHMYDGQEDQVAQVIANWADTLVTASAKRSGTPKNP
jgi:alpha/beta superfamily hydrolase